MTRLILAGESGPNLFRTDLGDLVVYFCERFVWGPLPAADKLASYLGPRLPDYRPADQWSVYVGRWPSAIDRAGKDVGLLEFCLQFDTVELWFDPAPNNQLQLIWLLDYFRPHPQVVSRLKLRLVDFELFDIPQTGLGKWKVQDVAVTDAELETASRAWQAYRSATPEACLALLTTDLSPLLMLKPALLKLFAELPSGTTGLGATEMGMLQMIAWGYANVNPLFYFRTQRGTDVFNQWELELLLEGLAHGPTPAVAGLDDELRTLDKTNHRIRHEPFLRSRLSLTEFGQAVVAHKEDFSRHNPIDRWWGGTRLTSDRLWRWNPTLVKP